MQTNLMNDVSLMNDISSCVDNDLCSNFIRDAIGKVHTVDWGVILSLLSKDGHR